MFMAVLADPKGSTFNFYCIPPKLGRVYKLGRQMQQKGLQRAQLSTDSGMVRSQINYQVL